MVENNVVYVAVTRANAVWRLPIAPDGTAVRIGVFLQLSGGRGQSCKSDVLTNVAYKGNELYITDSGAGCVLRATVPVAGRRLFAHL